MFSDVIVRWAWPGMYLQHLHLVRTRLVQKSSFRAQVKLR